MSHDVQGIGSKLMARMGYVMGQGLGKRSDGRAEPVPIQLLPQGRYSVILAFLVALWFRLINYQKLLIT